MSVEKVSVPYLSDNAQRVGFLAAALQKQLLSQHGNIGDNSSRSGNNKHSANGNSLSNSGGGGSADDGFCTALAAAATAAEAARATAPTADYFDHRRCSFSITEGAAAEGAEERQRAAAQVEALRGGLVDLDGVVSALKAKENKDYAREMRRIVRRREREMARNSGIAAPKATSLLSAESPPAATAGAGSGGGDAFPTALSPFPLAPPTPPLPSQAVGPLAFGKPSTAAPFPSTFFPPSFPFYSANPTLRAAKAAFLSSAKSQDIQIRFNSISAWDETHSKVLDLLTDDGRRDTIGLEAYKEAMVAFEEWCEARGFAEMLPRNQPIRGSTRNGRSDGVFIADTASLSAAADGGGATTVAAARTVEPSPSAISRCLSQSALAAARQPGLTLSLFYSCPAIPKDEDEDDEEDGDDDEEDEEEDEDADNGESSGKKKKGSKKKAGKDGAAAAEDINDGTLAKTIGAALPHTVDARALFAKYVKSISIVKTEAELIMCDEDCDGRVTLAELEGYMAEIVPTVAALHQLLPHDMIPYYTASSARRIFWLLDPTGRGSIKISSLVTHSVLDDWLDVQMTADEQPRNWFGATIATQLREKFEILDMFCTSSLNLDCLKRYKKGIPMVVDDGLPPDISPLSSLFLSRVFDTTCPPRGEMDYAAFIDFVVAVEFLPNSCPRPLFFWRIFDIFGEGRITPLVVHSFFKETYAKLKSAEVEVAPIEIIIQELFDLIPSKEPLVITKAEFLAASQCGLFSALVVDCLAVYTYENREHK